jgi:hemerythrin-like domain-containing protein
VDRQSVLEALRRDHEQITGQMKALAEAVSELGGADRSRMPGLIEQCREQVWSIKRAFLVHRCREEVGLFPDVERIAFRGAARVDALGAFFSGEAEHDIQAHLEVEKGLRKAADLLGSAARDEGDRKSTLGELREVAERTEDLMSRHAGKEDAVLFPTITQLLSAEQLAAVNERLRQLSEELGGGEG